MTGSRAWFGLVNQVDYSFAQTEELTLFRDLLKRNRELFWDNNMETLFEWVKVKTVEQVEEGVKRFEMDKSECLATDFCRTGLGFFLLQKDSARGPNCGHGHWRFVLAGSRTPRQGTLHQRESCWPLCWGWSTALIESRIYYCDLL